MTLTISLPAAAESVLQERANAAGRNLEQFVEQILLREIAGPLAESQSGDGSLDAQYERGYAQIPEDVTDLNALMPHLAVEQEKWE